jgi:hypothetical protein
VDDRSRDASERDLARLRHVYVGAILGPSALAALARLKSKQSASDQQVRVFVIVMRLAGAR